jgi:dethiobiotin synthetase
MSKASGLFITGTGTGVGKTYVASLIARALREAGVRVGVYKPVASGCELRGGSLVSPDAIFLWESAGRPGSLERVCPQMFLAPLAPHLAARAEGKRVEPVLLREGLEFWEATSDVVLVEGAGGLLSPMSDDDYNADVAAAFGYPLVVVAANELGTINATLQTLVTASTYCPAGSRGQGAGSEERGARSEDDEELLVAGIVLNSPRRGEDDLSVESNADELMRRCVAPLLASVEYGGGFDRDVDWLRLCVTAPGG